MIVVLDANVLYPAPVRDLLLQLADAKLFKPKWSARIQEEWIRNLLLNRKDLGSESLLKTVAAMNKAFPDATVAKDSALEESLVLPDPDDRHVLMTAIVSSAECIITANEKDFPAENLRRYQIIAIHPDKFVANLIAEDRETVCQAIYKIVHRLKNPPKSYHEVLASLEKCAMKKSARLLF